MFLWLRIPRWITSAKTEHGFLAPQPHGLGLEGYPKRLDRRRSGRRRGRKIGMGFRVHLVWRVSVNVLALPVAT